ncbi:glycoside hydrolase family 105 protein [Chitinophaga sp. CF118]|uniref:glycoside hydrolase family 88/105 protein n=1 Tax=Chitinophaga sp. CF118 TaxID=1884367 RepID=UPI00210154E3|nr:glycoside hydrolase family 88 protein [Chitinophaga sp. CF118]
MNNWTMKSVISATIALMLPFGAVKAQKIFRDWPLGTDPAAIGTYVANHYTGSQFASFGASTPAESIIYPEVCTWYGAFQVARATKNKDLLEKLVGRFDPLMAQSESLVPKADNIEHSVFGAVPIELYMRTNQNRYLSLGQPFADQQWDLPESLRPEQQKYSTMGLSWQTRMWVDDMYMITLLQVQAFRATANKKYVENAAREMVAYLDALQQPNGLFYHAQDAPFFWGRGNGLAAAGMTELLSELPLDNPNRSRILDSYKKLMAGIKPYQDKGYMWHELIDEPDAWVETSATGMFTFAMIVGVKKGWLDEKEYGPIAKNTWISLVKYINEAGDIKEVCENTGKKNNKQYYLDRRRLTGDLHGQAAILWCAAALLAN